ncbi:MAG: GDSL-type esterase/lipase family protein [Clostridia bacterium]|nr:GDSL-type esterase/lipase family protein [Clostridia bacterium]
MSQPTAVKNNHRYSTNQNRTNPLVLIAVIVAVLLLALFSLLKLLITPSGIHRGAGNVEEGLAVIKAMESADITEIENTIRANDDVKHTAQIQQMISDDFNIDEVNIWSLYKDVVICGDSRAVGFSYYGFMDENHVLADYGAYLSEIYEDIETIANVNPRYVFICTGVNDVGNNMYASSDDYATEYINIMDAISERCPGSTVVATSILDAAESAYETCSAWYDIEYFNNKLQKFCDERGYIYVDNTALCAQYTDLYESDGIHFGEAFYEPWARNMMKEVLEYESGN